MKNSKFIKQINFLDKEYIKNKKELYDNIEYVKSNLESLYMNINLAENDLIDYYIYSIKAEEAKYDYLLRILKKLDNNDVLKEKIDKVKNGG